MIVGLLGKSSKVHDVGVVGNESSVEVCKTQEGLKVLDFSGFRPILNGLNFSGEHGETIFGKNVAEVFNCISGEMTFVGAGIKFVLSESLEYFMDMSMMFLGVIRED